MLELPELELLRRELDREVAGRKIKSIAVGEKGALGTGTGPAAVASLEGAKATSVVRRPGVLAMGTDAGKRLVFELRGASPFRRTKGDEPTAFVVTFTQGAPLRVLKGTVKATVVADDAFDAAFPAPAGLDLVEGAVSWMVFARALVGRGGSLRALLLDDTVIAGLGPIYTDEILWHAGLRPDRNVDQFGTQELRRLSRAVAEVLHEAMKSGGSSTAAYGFTDLAGKNGGYTEQLEVVGRVGKPCRRCRRGTVATTKIDGKQATLCPECQV